MKRRTATIERYHVHGTMRYELRVTYRSETLWWNARDNGVSRTFYAIVQDCPLKGWGDIPDDVQACRDHAKRHGFTHVRIIGDWSKRTKPKGGAL